MRTALICLLALLPHLSHAGDVSRFCVHLGGLSEAVCNVPMSTLLARGEDFDGKLVVITGYYVSSDLPLLFSSETAFFSSDTANALAVTMPKDPRIAKKLNELNRRSVMLVGRYSMTPVNVTRFHGFITGGRLSEITSVGDAFSPWGFTENPPPGLSKQE